LHKDAPLDVVGQLGSAKSRSFAMTSKIVFSSDQFPSGFDERARHSVWRDVISNVCGPLDVSCRPDQPFSQYMVAAQFDGVSVARLRGTMDRVSWNRRDVRRPDFFLCLNRTPMALSQLGRDMEAPATAPLVGSCADIGNARWRDRNDLWLIILPQARLRERIAGSDDLVARPLGGDNAALRHLHRFLGIVPPPEEMKSDPDLASYIANTLTDLIVLTLGAQGDSAHIARLRGLRAARLREIIAEIGAGFADPAFSERRVAIKIGVTPRYIQHLLHDTGFSFTERLLETRLQRVRAMLGDPRHDRLKIADIAIACGFNEVSHLNRQFRRRFGASPTQYRGRDCAG
jgi:AraC-like DNA-binding protein